MNQISTKVLKNDKICENLKFLEISLANYQKIVQMENEFLHNVGGCFPITDKNISSFGEHTAELLSPTFR